MNAEVLASQKPIPQIPGLCDTSNICKLESSLGETYTKHNKITLKNLTAEFMSLKAFLIDKLHSVNKNRNLNKNNINNGQILDEVKQLRDDSNSKNTIIKLLTESISDITKSLSNKPNQEKSFMSPKNHAKILTKLQLQINILFLWEIGLAI